MKDQPCPAGKLPERRLGGKQVVQPYFPLQAAVIKMGDQAYQQAGQRALSGARMACNQKPFPTFNGERERLQAEPFLRIGKSGFLSAKLYAHTRSMGVINPASAGASDLPPGRQWQLVFHLAGPGAAFPPG